MPWNSLAKKMPLENLRLAYIFLKLIKSFMKKFKAALPKGEKNTERKNNRIKKPKGHSADEIVKRHLSNKNDKITKQDFENLKIDLSLPEDKARQPLPIKIDKERPKDADKDNTVTTPWDVISE